MEEVRFTEKEFQEASGLYRERRAFRIASYVFLGLSAIALILGFYVLYGVEIEPPEGSDLGTGIAMAFALMAIYAAAVVPIFIGFALLILAISLLLAGLLTKRKKARGYRERVLSLAGPGGKEREKLLMESLRKRDYEGFLALQGPLDEAPGN